METDWTRLSKIFIQIVWFPLSNHAMERGYNAIQYLLPIDVDIVFAN